MTQIDASHFDRGDRLHLGLALPRRRSDAAHLPHARRRQDLDGDHARPRRQRAGQRRARGSEDAKGLLFAGTEREVYVSFNDGDDWQPLTLNLPHTSVRDLIVHGDDLAIATHGRGFWILDNMTPLRDARGAWCRTRAPALGARLQPGCPLRPAGRLSPAARQLHRHAAAAGDSRRTEPARRRDHRLLPRRRRGRPGDAGDSITATAQARSPLRERRHRREPLDEKDGQRADATGRGRRRRCRRRRACTASSGICATRRPARCSATSRSPPIAGDTPLEPLGVLALPGAYTVRLTVGGRTLHRTADAEDGSARDDHAARPRRNSSRSRRRSPT